MFQIKFRILKIVKIENKYRVRDKLSQTEETSYQYYNNKEENK